MYPSGESVPLIRTGAQYGCPVGLYQARIQNSYRNFQWAGERGKHFSATVLQKKIIMFGAWNQYTLTQQRTTDIEKVWLRPVPAFPFIVKIMRNTFHVFNN